MKRSFVILIVLAVVLHGCLSAKERNIGLGMILGEPTGVSFKKWLGENTAADFALAWSFAGEASFHIHADYLIHDFNLIKVKRGKCPVYYGVGTRFKNEEDIRLAVRVPVGISYMFDTAPIDIFFEFGLLLDLFPESTLSINSSIGFRYFF